jgi:hypothetical protein
MRLFLKFITRHFFFLFLKMEIPNLSESQRKSLTQILASNPKQEVVGYFEVDSDRAVLELHEVARGDDEKVAFRDFQKFPFHTHPLGALCMPEPPSGEDLLQALSWGYPDYNAEKRHTQCECIVASEGLWWYSASDSLRDLFFGLQDTDEEKLAYFSKQLVRYLNVMVACFKNKILAFQDFLVHLRTVDFNWMAALFDKNPGLVSYLEGQFPLGCVAKLRHIKFPALSVCEGFNILFV